MSKISGLNMFILGALLCMRSSAISSQAPPVGSVTQAVAAAATKAVPAATKTAPAKTVEEHQEAKKDLKKMLDGKSPSEIAALGKQVVTAGGAVGKAAVAAVSALVSKTKWPTCPDGFAMQGSADGCCASQALKHMKQAKMLCESDDGSGVWKTTEDNAGGFRCCPPAQAPAPATNAKADKEVDDLKAQVAALKAQLEKDHESTTIPPAKASQASHIQSKDPVKNTADKKTETDKKALSPKKRHGKKTGTTEEKTLEKALTKIESDPMMKIMMNSNADPFGDMDEEDPLAMPKISGMPPVMEEMLKQMDGGAGSEELIEIHPGPDGKMVEMHTHLEHPAGHMQVIDMDPLLFPERQSKGSSRLPNKIKNVESWLEKEFQQEFKSLPHTGDESASSWKLFHYVVMAAVVIGFLWWFNAGNSDMRSVFIPGYGNVKLAGGKKMNEEHCDLFAHSDCGYGGAEPMSNIAGARPARLQTHGHRFHDNFDDIGL